MAATSSRAAQASDALRTLKARAEPAVRASAKLGLEHLLWTRARATSNVTARLAARRGEAATLPAPLQPVEPTAVLQDRQEWQDAVAQARSRHLPLHRDLPKNWDTLGAAATVLARVGPSGRVLDSGAARYSTLLVWLYTYGLRDLVGINLEFQRTVRHGSVRFEPGDATATRFATGSFDAITCLSVIEHGVPLAGFFAESARLLRPGGVLVVSTDYDAEPPDTTGLTAYGAPIHIFSPAEIHELVKLADEAGFDLDGELTDAKLAHPQRPVHWARFDLRYTFIRLTFTRR
jgi:SAM-dependent methyltransferase